LFNVLTNKIVTVVDIAQCASALVVTMATIEDFVATWSSDLASPLVMLTPNNTHEKRNGSTWIRMDDKLCGSRTDL